MKKSFFIFFLTIVIIFSGCETYPFIGKNYLLDYDTWGDNIILKSPNRIAIEGSILDYRYDSTFILALQKPRDSVCECNENCLEKTYPDFRNLRTLDMCKEAFEKSILRKYWIINKITDSVYGPLSKNFYILKRIELKVPEELELKSE